LRRGELACEAVAAIKGDVPFAADEAADAKVEVANANASEPARAASQIDLSTKSLSKMLELSA
jgi:hypothetical protein